MDTTKPSIEPKRSEKKKVEPSSDSDVNLNENESEFSTFLI